MVIKGLLQRKHTLCGLSFVIVPFRICEVTRMRLYEELGKRILFLDGAMGTAGSRFEAGRVAGDMEFK